MHDDAQDTPDDGNKQGPLPFRSEEGHLSSEWLDLLRGYLASESADAVRELMAPLHEADTGDVLETLDPGERVQLVRLLGDAFDYSALTEVDDSVRLELMESLPNAEIARGVADLDSDDAVYIIEDLDEEDREEILAQIPVFERLSLKRSLDFPEDSAGRLMQTDFIAIPPFWTVGQTIDYMRTTKDLPDDFYQIYVVDPGYKLLGTIPLDRILRSERLTRISDIMNEQVRQLEATTDQEEAARVFERYNLIEIAVIDESERLVGVLTIDDIVDVIHEEASEDIHRLGGVGDEDISGTVPEVLRSRATWLLVNLGTATVSSVVIGFFGATIEQMVALAVLMPIVASMGGVAGTQTMTVTVRAISQRELDKLNTRRLIRRELAVALANGVLFAILLGVVTLLRFSNLSLAVVIGLAMIVNMLVAGTCGILIPLGLDRLKIDPAVASSTFVMTFTDVVGFFAFLALAGWWFGLF